MSTSGAPTSSACWWTSSLGGSAGSATGNSLPLTLVFCNTVASCRAAEHGLAESGVSCLCYHGDISSDREENLGRYHMADSGGGGIDTAAVLVCTDIASRGLDVPQVDQVVMFDFPLNPIDYLHPAGRTARGLGGGGTSAKSRPKPGEIKVTPLMAKRDRRSSPLRLRGPCTGASRWRG